MAVSEIIVDANGGGVTLNPTVLDYVKRKRNTY